jgi:hypothetical protein
VTQPLAGTTARAVVAAKRHRCDAYGGPVHHIEAGVEYVRTTVFPGDVNSSGRPSVARVCVACWSPRPLPPNAT